MVEKPVEEIIKKVFGVNIPRLALGVLMLVFGVAVLVFPKLIAILVGLYLIVSGILVIVDEYMKMLTTKRGTASSS